MAKRRRLAAPDATELADFEAGFAAKPVPDRLGVSAPISQIAAEAARLAQPLDVESRVTMARDEADAGQWRQAQADGRVLAEVPLAAVVMDHVVRDRVVADAAEMAELKASIRAGGMRLPVEVVALADGRFGLISGWRRMTALHALQAEHGAEFATVRVLLRPAAESGAVYTAMVEENEIRAQLTPYERGRIAVVAAGQGAFASVDAAVDVIFAAASKAKRSKIRSFATVHEELGDLLQHPTLLSERNGLRLAQALRQPGMIAALRGALGAAAPGTAEQEWARIERILQNAGAAAQGAARGGRPRREPQGEQIGGVRLELSAGGDAVTCHLPKGDTALREALLAHLRDWLQAPRK